MNRPQSIRAWIRPAIAAPYVLAAKTTSLPPHTLFGSMTPKEWYWLNVYGEEVFPSLREYLPVLPSEELQVRFTGDHGEHTLREAFSFYRTVTRAASHSRPQVAIDFGCGWGRITRFFIKDFEKGKLVGVDPVSDVIEISRSTNPWANFEKIDLRPPIQLPSSSVDLIFAFSVFSHLTEDVHLQWIEEFARLLRSGGVLVVTTRERDFILECAKIRNENPDPSTMSALDDVATIGARTAFLDTQRYLDLSDKGEFCCDPTGAGSDLPPDAYGETCIPLEYVQRRWCPQFSITDFLVDSPGLKQNVIVAKRR
jgi:ubiquinone/menaquinone biosynthesis C-methylase UbiE